MDYSKRVLDADGLRHRTEFAASCGDVPGIVQSQKALQDVAMNLPKAKDLASWENEGGATAPAPTVVKPVARSARASQATKYQSLSEDAPRGADRAASDTHALAIMRISLLLLIPAIGGGAIYWGLLVGSASQ
jgi:hypothetical protein